MASTFQLTSKTYDGRYIRLNCTQTKDIATNKSTIAWTLTVAGGSAAYYSTGPTTVKINGTTVYSKARVSWEDRIFPAAKGSVSGSITVSHNDDGNRSISVSLATAIYTSSVTTVSDTWTLDSIPRYATLTSAASFDDESNPTITYSNPQGSNVTTLQACISLTGAAADIAYRDISKTGSSYTFPLTTSERNILRNACTDANSRSVVFVIKTTIDGNTYTHTLRNTLYIVNAAPGVSASIQDSNADTIALTGDSSKFIKYYSNAAFSITAQGQKGATITGRRISCGGKSAATASGTLEGVESAAFVVSAEDSRGNVTEITVQKTLVNYVKPTINLSAAALTPDGDITFTAAGNAFAGSFGSATNALHVYYRYKEGSGNYSSWVEVTATAESGNKYSASGGTSGVDYTKIITLQVKVEDSITNATREVKLSAVPVFTWGKDFFNFNVIPQLLGVALVEANFTEKWAKFASGLLIQWGSANVAANTAQGEVSFNKSFAQIQAVFMQNNYSNTKTVILSSSGLTNNSFKANVYDVSTKTTPTVQTFFYWLAIGRG